MSINLNQNIVNSKTMSFEDYIKIYGDNYIKAVTYKFYLRLIKPLNVLDYEDCVQEVMILLFRQWNDFNQDKAGLNTFIFMKVRTCMYNLLKVSKAKKRGDKNKDMSLDYSYSNSSKNNKRDDGDEYYNFVGDDSSQELYSETDKEEQLIEECVKQCRSEIQKTAFRMYLQGYSLEEISQAIGKTKRNTQEMCYRIRKNFRNGIYKIDI